MTGVQTCALPICEGADKFVEDKILDAMSGTLDTAEAKKRLSIWRTFFREYLRYVSHMDPDILGVRQHIIDRKSVV